MIHVSVNAIRIQIHRIESAIIIVQNQEESKQVPIRKKILMEMLYTEHAIFEAMVIVVSQKLLAIKMTVALGLCSMNCGMIDRSIS